MHRHFSTHLHCQSDNKVSCCNLIFFQPAVFKLTISIFVNLINLFHAFACTSGLQFSLRLAAMAKCWRGIGEVILLSALLLHSLSLFPLLCVFWKDVSLLKTVLHFLSRGTLAFSKKKSMFSGLMSARNSQNFSSFFLLSIAQPLSMSYIPLNPCQEPLCSRPKFPPGEKHLPRKLKATLTLLWLETGQNVVVHLTVQKPSRLLLNIATT